jgi:hypothetical protein
LDDGPRRYPAGDLFQAAASIAGIAIALAAFVDDTLLAFLFLISGLSCLAGAAYALSVLWMEAGLDLTYLLPRRSHEDLAERYEALVYLAWGMILLGAAYVVLFLRRL